MEIFSNQTYAKQRVMPKDLGIHIRGGIKLLMDTFSYFWTKNHVVGAQKNHLNELFLSIETCLN